MTITLDTALLAARTGVRLADDAACLRAYDALEARYGWPTASRAWSQACAEMDAERGEET